MMQAVKTCIALICLAAAAFPGATLGQPSHTPPDNGKVSFGAAAGNEIMSLFTKLIVPPEPAPVGTLFLWPGLQPRRGEANYLRKHIQPGGSRRNTSTPSESIRAMRGAMAARS